MDTEHALLTNVLDGVVQIEHIEVEVGVKGQ